MRKSLSILLSNNTLVNANEDGLQSVEAQYLKE